MGTANRRVAGHPSDLPAGVASSCALTLAVLLCAGGLVWNVAVTPRLDDSDPSAFIGYGLLLFGVPALWLSIPAVVTRFLPRQQGTAMSFWIALAAVTLASLPVVGLTLYELLASRTLWSR